MADAISITDNALLSIVHRIQTSFPDYLLVQEGAANSVTLSPNAELQQEVRFFLADGGFTAINEQELRDYYELEMQEYSRLQRIKDALQEYGWIKWAAGTVLIAGASIGAAALVRKLKA